MLHILTKGFVNPFPPGCSGCPPNGGATGSLKLTNFAGFSFSRKGKINYIFDRLLSRSYNSLIDVKDIRKINKLNYLNENSNDFSLVKGSYEYFQSIAAFRNLTWNKRSSKDWSHYDLGCLVNKKEFKNNVIRFLNSLQPHQSYSVLFDSISNNSQIISLDKSYLINYDTNPDILLISIKRHLDDKAFKYGLDVYSHISARYSGISLKVANLTFENIDTPVVRKVLDKKGINHRFLSNKYVPFSMDYYKNSVITDRYINEFNENVIVYKYEEKYLHVIENKEIKENKVEIFNKDNQLIDEFIDSDYGDYFIRQVDTLYFKISNENVMYLESPSHVKFNKVNKLTRKDYIFNDKILTFDIETFSNHCIPYSCGFYDGDTCYTYYLTDYSSIDAMIIDCFRGMLTSKYNNYTVYIHNLAKFDGNLIYKVLLEHFEIKPLSSNKDKVYSYEIKNIIDLQDSNNDVVLSKKVTKLILKDSLRILPSSLRRLGKSFNVETLKGVFPYKFVNENNLLYEGQMPGYRFFNKHEFKLSEYFYLRNEYNDGNWNTKNETIKYLKGDLMSLYEILQKYISEVHKKHKINVVNSISISSLSSKIFYTDYYKDSHKLPILTGDIEKFHRRAFYGGLSDVIKPYANKDVKSYDFVSMYPSVMNDLPFPTGNPIFTTNTNLDELFGFFYAKIKVPYFKIPMVPTRINGVVICPTGELEGEYCTEDLKTFRKYGCEVEVMYGYTYEKTYGIFSEFIKEKFEIKNTSEGAAREIAKLNMNSLFGFSGRHNYYQVVKIVTKEEKETIESIYPVYDFLHISKSDKYHIRYSSIPDKTKCIQSGVNYERLLVEANKNRYDLEQISLPAAVFIAAYARTRLTAVIQNNADHILNFDTDGLKITKELKGNFMGTALGQLKEDVKNISEYIGVAPKFYTLLLNNGKHINKGKSIRNEDLEYEDYLNLLAGKNITKDQTKWYSSLTAGKVEIKDLPIEISHNLTKREKVYSLGKWIDTRPFCVINGKIISTALVKVNNDLIVYKEVSTSIVSH